MGDDSGLARGDPQEPSGFPIVSYQQGICSPYGYTRRDAPLEDRRVHQPASFPLFQEGDTNHTAMFTPTTVPPPVQLKSSLAPAPSPSPLHLPLPLVPTITPTAITGQAPTWKNSPGSLNYKYSMDTPGIQTGLHTDISGIEAQPGFTMEGFPTAVKFQALNDGLVRPEKILEIMHSNACAEDKGMSLSTTISDRPNSQLVERVCAIMGELMCFSNGLHVNVNDLHVNVNGLHVNVNGLHNTVGSLLKRVGELESMQNKPDEPLKAALPRQRGRSQTDIFADSDYELEAATTEFKNSRAGNRQAISNHSSANNPRTHNAAEIMPSLNTIIPEMPLTDTEIIVYFFLSLSRPLVALRMKARFLGPTRIANILNEHREFQPLPYKHNSVLYKLTRAKEQGIEAYGVKWQSDTLTRFRAAHDDKELTDLMRFLPGEFYKTQDPDVLEICSDGFRRLPEGEGAGPFTHCVRWCKENNYSCKLSKIHEVWHSISNDLPSSDY